MPIIEKHVTKLYLILKERSISQAKLHKMIQQENNGESVSLYVINEIVTGKRKNYHINTAILISNALNVPIDDIVD
jgi:transcriptional regulator with XRE-family HTH domain